MTLVAAVHWLHLIMGMAARGLWPVVLFDAEQAIRRAAGGDRFQPWQRSADRGSVRWWFGQCDPVYNPC